MLPKLTFILGGAASGKSAYAETCVLDAGLTPVYLATAQAFDAEMRAKITLHRQRRNGWTDLDAPIDPAAAIMTRSASDVILLDCLTMWLTNLMLDDHDIGAATKTLIRALHETQAKVVIVSNEVGAGIVPDNALSRRFRQKQGEMNQKIAAISDLAILVTAGLPLALKGELPT